MPLYLWLALFVVIWGTDWSKQFSYCWVYTGVSDQGIRNSLSTFTQYFVVNLISGILLLVERPLATTDLVNVGKYEGEVTTTGIRSLTVKTFDNQEVIIPNSAVNTKPFTNRTRCDVVLRTILMVGRSYEDDPHQPVEIIAALRKDHLAVFETPAPPKGASIKHLRISRYNLEEPHSTEPVDDFIYNQA